VLSGALALPTLVLTILRMVDVTSSPALGRVASLLMVGVGVLAGGRVLVHLRDRYWQWQGAPDREWTVRDRHALNGFVVVDSLVALVLIGCGAWFFMQPDNWLELGLFTVLALATIVASVETVGLAAKGGLPRGSETIGNCFAVRWVRKATKAFYPLPRVRRIDVFVWETRTHVTRVSGLVIVIVLLLLGGALSQAVAVAPQVKHYLSQPLRPKQGGQDSGSIGAPSLAQAAPPPARPRIPLQSGVATTITQPGPRLAAPPPTYDQLCGTALSPGDGAPPQEAAALKQAWFQLGGAVAACAERAQLVTGSSNVYYALGQCDGRPRSIGVVGPDQAAVMLLDEPAALARRMALEGTLRGASARTPIGDGDFQIVDTVAGSYVVIRRQVTDGHGGLRGVPERCADIQSSAAAEYVTVPPALVGLWLQLGRLGRPTWPAIDPARSAMGDTAFDFYASDSVEPVATGSCSSPTSCQLRADGIVWTTTSGGATVTTEQVRADGPTSSGGER
jgi:hypothetical protein